VSTGGDLDQLCESISDLSDWQGAEEAKVEEGVDWRVVCSQTILVVAVVDGNLDGDRGVDQTNDSGWYTDEVGVSAVGRTSETVKMS